MFKPGQLCGDLEPVNEGPVARLLRFGRSADEMHSRVGRQAPGAAGDVFANAQTICEVRYFDEIVDTTVVMVSTGRY